MACGVPLILNHERGLCGSLEPGEQVTIGALFWLDAQPLGLLRRYPACAFCNRFSVAWP